MNQLDIWFLALALAMDCFAVSIASGIIVKKHLGKMMIRMAFLFGLFQAAMPLIGWLGVSTFTSYLENIDHWIAFGLLAFLGGRMIRESFLPEEEKKIKPRKLKTQVVLAIATSIDALAVGISFACTGFSNIKMLVCPLLIIGFVCHVYNRRTTGSKIRQTDYQETKTRTIGRCYPNFYRNKGSAFTSLWFIVNKKSSS